MSDISDPQRKERDRMALVWITTGAIVAIAFVSFMVHGFMQPHGKVRLAGEPTASTSATYPVYRLVDRMDITLNGNRKGKSSAYILERGGMLEYVSADNIKMIGAPNDTNAPMFYLKMGDTFWGLHKY